MKKVTLLVAVVLLAMVWSCGNGSSSSDLSEDSNSNSEKSMKKKYFEKLKTYDLSTEEGMLRRLSDYYNLTVPSQLSFVEIKNKDSRKMILKAENVTEEDLAKLNEWYKKECQRLVDDGYKKTLMQDNAESMGMIFNDSFYQKKTDFSTSTEWRWNSISLYSVYKIDEKVYELRIGLNE